MFSNSGLMMRFAPLLASLALFSSCCFLLNTPALTPTPAPTATPACKMHFTQPAGGAVLYQGSQVDFSWSTVEHISSYLLAENLPANGGQVIFYPNGNSYPLDTSTLGSYIAVIQARDANANILCQDNIHYSIVPAPTATMTPTRTRIPPPPPTKTKAPEQHKPKPKPTATRARTGG